MNRPLYYAILPVLLLMVSLSASAEIVKSYTLSQPSVCQGDNRLIVFSVSQMPYLTGLPARQLALFRFAEASSDKHTNPWQSIVFQIDQKDTQGRFLLPLQQNRGALLSAQDELVIRAKDLGQKLDPDSELLRQNKLLEIKVLSQSLDNAGWFYINIKADKGSLALNPERQLNYNKIQDTVASQNFKIRFSKSKPFLIDAFHWRLNNGLWSENLIDMMKIRHSGRFFGLKFRRTQDDYSSILAAVKQGPLRVIRRTENRIKVFWKLKTPLLFIDYIMLPDGFIMDTIIDIPFKISYFFSDLETFTTMDWNPDQSGYLSVYSPKLGAYIAINGMDSALKQTFNRIEDHYFSVKTFKGTLDVDLQIPDNFPIRAMLYLADKPDTVDPPENFPGQTANVGFRTIGWENIDSQLYHLKFTVCVHKQD